MKWISLLTLSFVIAACGSVRKPHEPTFNEKMLKEQRARRAAGEDMEDVFSRARSSDPVEASLWAKSKGSPYLLRNQKAQKVGDLLTIVIMEEASATTSANTDTKRESDLELDGALSLGNSAASQKGVISGTSEYSSEFKGSGTTDRSGSLTATVQAVVEEVLPNGNLFVRGRKVITINNEDQEVEITGFVRPDDIKINNLVNSKSLADAKIRYLGNGVVADKQRVGWGTRLLDFVWPF